MIELMKDAEVFSSVGEKIGLLNRVVLEPETKEVSHIVVKEGVLFSTSKVIPISYINLDGKRITLTKTAMELEDLPDFIESSYIRIDETNNPEQNAGTVYFYPPRNFAWWATGGHVWYPKPKYVLKSEKILPEGMVALEEGADVISKDGEDIGNIDEVIVETAEDHATHILVSKGFLAKEHKLVPTLWIKDVTEEKVYLSIDSGLFEHLPEHEAVRM